MPDQDGNITFGVVGLGMGSSRARTVAATEGARLLAVCDLREDRAKEVGERHSCDWYTDYERMLVRDDIDVIYVMTFSGLHAEHGIMAAKAGKHVISTKPLDVTLAAVDALIGECRKQGVKLVTDFDLRYSANPQTVRHAVQSGALGKIFLAEARLKWFREQSYYDENGGWRGTWRFDGGGSLSNQTVHYVDQLCWIMGDVKSVYAELGVFNHKIEGEDMGLAILNFASGAKGAICGTTTFPQSHYSGVEIHGDRGAVLTTHGKEIDWVWAPGCDTDPEKLRIEPEVKSAAADMVRAIKENRDPQTTGEDGRKSVVLLEAMRRSNETGLPVTL